MFQIFKAIFGVKSKAAQGRIEAARNREKPAAQAAERLRREKDAYWALLAQVEGRKRG